MHLALALQTILLKVAEGSWIVDDEDCPIDRWLSKTTSREQVELLDAYVQQAQIAGNFDIIIEHLREAFDRPNGLLNVDKCFGQPGANSYLFEVPTLGFNGETNSPLALNCSNLKHPLPDGWTALNDPALKKTYYYHEETRATTWTRPTPNAQPNPEVLAQERLPPTKQGGIDCDTTQRPAHKSTPGQRTPTKT